MASVVFSFLSARACSRLRRKRGLFCWLWLLWLGGVQVGANVELGMGESPHEQRAVDGKLMGVLGAYFRYYNVYMKGPSEQDEAEAVRLADFARCDVCETMMSNILRKHFTKPAAQNVTALEAPDAGADPTSLAEEKKQTISSGENDKAGVEAHRRLADPDSTEGEKEAPALTAQEQAVLMVDDEDIPFVQRANMKKMNADSLLDYLEGHRDPIESKDTEVTVGNRTDKDTVKDQVLSRKVGCNKLFKDDFLYPGYILRPCAEEERKTEPCVHPPEHGGRPSDHSVNTYELWKEIVFFSCEQTIAGYREEMVDVILREVKKKKSVATIPQLAAMACRKAGKCDRKLASSRKPMPGGIGSENPNASPAGKKSAKKKKRPVDKNIKIVDKSKASTTPPPKRKGKKASKAAAQKKEATSSPVRGEL
ncbi:unnamed protein product [Amoebophrya sp. A25]|nr:unnamed protein product [Amoebophrya sp. A25]|eukprot:GSA25T00011278001.1